MATFCGLTQAGLENLYTLLSGSNEGAGYITNPVVIPGTSTYPVGLLTNTTEIASSNLTFDNGNGFRSTEDNCIATVTGAAYENLSAEGCGLLTVTIKMPRISAQTYYVGIYFGDTSGSISSATPHLIFGSTEPIVLSDTYDTFIRLRVAISPSAVGTLGPNFETLTNTEADSRFFNKTAYQQEISCNEVYFRGDVIKIDGDLTVGGETSAVQKTPSNPFSFSSGYANRTDTASGTKTLADVKASSALWGHTKPFAENKGAADENSDYIINLSPGQIIYAALMPNYLYTDIWQTWSAGAGRPTYRGTTSSGLATSIYARSMPIDGQGDTTWSMSGSFPYRKGGEGCCYIPNKWDDPVAAQYMRQAMFENTADGGNHFFLGMSPGCTPTGDGYFYVTPELQEYCRIAQLSVLPFNTYGFDPLNIDPRVGQYMTPRYYGIKPSRLTSCTGTEGIQEGMQNISASFGSNVKTEAQIIDQGLQGVRKGSGLYSCFPFMISPNISKDNTAIGDDGASYPRNHDVQQSSLASDITKRNTDGVSGGWATADTYQWNERNIQIFPYGTSNVDADNVFIGGTEVNRASIRGTSAHTIDAANKPVSHGWVNLPIGMQAVQAGWQCLPVGRYKPLSGFGVFNFATGLLQYVDNDLSGMPYQDQFGAAYWLTKNIQYSQQQSQFVGAHHASGGAVEMPLNWQDLVDATNTSGT